MTGYRQVPRRAVSERRTSAPSARPVVDDESTLTPSRRHRPDYAILLLCAALLVIGLVVVFAISPALAAATRSHSNNYVTHQILAIGLSIIAFVFTAQFPVSRWNSLQKPLIIAAVAATFLAIIIPVNPEYPAHRWVRMGGLSFQSVELVKFVLILWLSAFLAKQARGGKMNDFKSTLKPLSIVLAVGGAAVVAMQSDLGSAGVMICMVGAMAFVSGLDLRRIALIGAAILILVTLAVASTPYRRERLGAFLHPTADCQDSGYQACQALIAVGSGGFIGLGLGRSVQAYGYLPEAANDSIFAIYAEKFGFIGSVVLLLLFAALFARLAKIAEHAPNIQTRLIVVGVLTWLAVQAMINIGAMIGLFPLKGITLPFISYGGTSVIFMAAAMGLVFQISRYTTFVSPLEGRKGQRYDNNRHGRRIGRAHYADSSSRR